MMAGDEEPVEQSGPATTDATSQQQPAQQLDWCSICLGDINNAAYIDGCFHTFCLGCIRRWAEARASCPLCRQPFDRVLHTVRADDSYHEYVVASSASQQRPVPRERDYHPYPRTTRNEAGAGRRRPAVRRRRVRGDTAPRHSTISAQQAAGERPSSPELGVTFRYDLLALRTRLIAFTENQ